MNRRDEVVYRHNTKYGAGGCCFYYLLVPIGVDDCAAQGTSLDVAQPFHGACFALLFAGGAAIAFAIAVADTSAPLWGRLLSAGFGVVGFGLAGLVVLIGVVVAGPEGVSSYRAWRERRRWISWDEVESFGTHRDWSDVGVVLHGGEFQLLAPVVSFVGSIDSVVVVAVMAVVAAFRRKTPSPITERTVRRMVRRVAEVCYQVTGDVSPIEIVVVEVPRRPSRRVSIGGRRAHDERMANGDSAPFLLPSERARAQAESRRTSQGGDGNVDTD